MHYSSKKGFHIFKNYLLEQGVPESHIITIELDQRKNKKYRDPDAILYFYPKMSLQNLEDEAMKFTFTH